MSEDVSVELARRAHEAVRRRDRTTWLSLHDADFEIVRARPSNAASRVGRGAGERHEHPAERLEAQT
jgi:hypothetical protein